MVLIRSFSPRSAPVLYEPPPGGCRHERDPADVLPGTKTSGSSSRQSRTPAQTLPPVRTLLPPVSASPSPGRPTRSLPTPDVDSHATPAAFLRGFAHPPRARHVAPQSQDVSASTAARRAPPRETVPWGAPFARGHRVERLFDDFEGRWTCEWEARHCAPTKRPKLDLSARTRYRGALLERWLAQFWNEAQV